MSAFLAGVADVNPARATEPAPTFQVPPTALGSNQSAAPDDSDQSAAAAASEASVEAVTLRLKDSLTPEMAQNFKLFVYIDKAESGPFAQRMYVFQKTDSGDLAILYDWPVSTGRQRIEHDVHGKLQSSLTPLGYFELDPKRLYADHTSSQWNEAMPFAMFFNWKPNGRQTGLAIHGTPDENAGLLGTPASAGCVRLSLDNARVLFGLVQSQSRGPTPKLAYLDGEAISSEGLLLHDGDGRLQLADGYSVLVLIDNYGGESRVSSLY